MIDFIAATVIGLAWFLLGFLFGNLNGTKRDVKEFIDETGQKILIETKRLVNPLPTIPTGRIRPVTSQEAAKRARDPQHQEALDETLKTLDAIPDLVAAKELANQMRKESYAKN